MLEWKGQPRTPKEMAAHLIWAAIEDLAADWQPDWRERPGNPLTGAGPTASEIAAVRYQMGRYLERLRELLRVEQAVAAHQNAVGAILPPAEYPGSTVALLDGDLEARELQAELEERQ